MAMHDWNHDGKNDIWDNMIEFDRFSNTNSKTNGNAPKIPSGNGNKRSTGSKIFWCIILGWGAIKLFIMIIDFFAKMSVYG